MRGDLIEAYKILNNCYDKNVLTNLLQTKHKSEVRHSLRGHKFMLRTQSFKTRIRKHLFSVSITNHWNKLPNHVVEATNLNMFKTLVDRYYKNTATITIISTSRKWKSQFVLMNYLIIMADKASDQ